MIGFYDKMLPSFINKFVKKYKTKLTEGSIKDLKNTNEYYNVPFLEITPEMKMDIYEKGVPIAKVKKKKVNQQSTRMA